MQRLVLALVLALAALLLPAGGASADPRAATAPVASSAAAASASAAGSAPAPEPALPPSAAPESAPVQLLDRTVFSVRASRGNQSAHDRAREAAHVLERATREKEIPEVRVEEQGGVAVVYVGAAPLIQLGIEDAAAAGDASASVHAAAVVDAVRDALAKERSRSRIATSVFSFSLLVFSGLLALLLLRKVRELADQGRAWLTDNPERISSVQMGGIEMLRPAAFQSALSVALGVARALAQVAICVTWFLFSLSLFEATSGYGTRLAGLVLAPVSDMTGRLARSVPVFVIALLAALALLVLLRFVGVFFESIERGETSLSWLPPDLAAPTSVLVRFGVAVAALVFAAPLVTGNKEGALARIGVVVLATVGLACTPLAASAVAGVAVLYGRRLRVGDVADVGGRSGRVRELNLLETRLEDEDGCVVRVPHLLSLVRPSRVAGRTPLVAVEISVAASADLEAVRALLVATGSRLGSRARASVVALDEGGAHFRATMACDAADARGRWLMAIAADLAAAGIALGRPPSGAARPLDERRSRPS